MAEAKKSKHQDAKSDIKALVAQIMNVFQPALIDLILSAQASPPGLTPDHFWLAVARFKLNKKELCDDDCEEEEGVHFHDSDNWFGADERKVLDEFWHKLKPAAQKKAQTYVDELVAFTKKNSAALLKLIHDQTESTREFLETVINKDSKEFIESLLVPQVRDGDEKTTEVTKSFAFHCAVVCMLMDYHDKADQEESVETGWFETFFQYFLADQDDSDDEDESDEEEDDDYEKDEDDDGDDDESEDDDDESEDDESDSEEEEEEDEKDQVKAKQAKQVKTKQVERKKKS